MREIKTHRVKSDYYSNQLEVSAIGERGSGGANLEYQIRPDKKYLSDDLFIKFQHGDPSILINGISNESLLAIVLDRLDGFQGGKFPSDETAFAIEHIERALASMQTRTLERIDRGVIGELKK